MNQKKINIVITLCLSFSCFTIGQYFTNCLTSFLVKDFINPDQYIQICTECQQSFILSSDYSQCLHPSYHQDKHLMHCLRINEMNNCAEAICGLEIKQGTQEYINQPSIHLDEKCSNFNQDTQKCSFPRLGYTLNIPEYVLSLDNQSFCAIYDTVQQNCLTYFDQFIRVEGNNYPVFLKQFTNFYLLDQQLSSSQGLVCKDGSAPLTDTSTKQKGCRENQFDSYCVQNHPVFGNCIKCQDMYSINSVTRVCEPIDQNYCRIHRKINGEFICIQCIDGYQAKKGQCKVINPNCVQLTEIGQKCLICKSPYQGDYCEQENTNPLSMCEHIWNSMCVKCKYNDLYFLNLKEQQCIKRVFSTYCKNKSYFYDSCTEIEVKPLFYLEIPQLTSIERFNFDIQILKTKNIVQIEQEFKYYNSQYNGIFDVFKNYLNQLEQNINFSSLQKYLKELTQIEFCIEYSKISNLCIQCQQNYYLKFNYDKFIYECDSLPQTDQIPECLVQVGQLCLQCQSDFYFQPSDQKCQSLNLCAVYQCKDNFYELTRISQSKNQKIKKYCKSLNYYSNNYEQLCYECYELPDLFIAKVEIPQINSVICEITSSPCLHIKNGICIKCQKGYTMDVSLDKCIQYPLLENCSVSESQTNCLSCNDGFQLISGKCIKRNGYCTNAFTCDSKTCKKNCPSIFKNDLSQKCNFECLQKNYLENYMNYSYQCLMCNLPYCEICLDYPFNFQSGCFKCFDGYYLQNNWCYLKCENGEFKQNKQECNPNCEKWEGNSSCIQCKNEIFLKEGNCVDFCPSDYISYKSTNKYFYCLKKPINCDYYVDESLISQFKFDQAVKCKNCNNGLIFDPSKNDCVQQCDYFYDSNLLQCTKECKFLKNDNICSSFCDKYYTFINTIINNSQFWIPKCIDSCTGLYVYDDKSLCQDKCEMGYYKDSDTQKLVCHKCLPNCNQCSRADYCDICNSGYEKINDICMYKCWSNGQYVENKDKCNDCKSNCSKCDITKKCYECKEGYKKNDDYTCICNSSNCSCSTNCNQCINGVCSQCRARLKQSFRLNLALILKMLQCSMLQWHAAGHPVVPLATLQQFNQELIRII